MKDAPLVVGISATKNAGKTTLARHFIEKGFVELAIANKLKQACSHFLGIPIPFFNDNELKETPFLNPVYVTAAQLQNIAKAFNVSLNEDESCKYLSLNPFISPRDILQRIGTDFLRQLDSSIHFKNITINTPTVVSDVRFIDEYNFFKNNFNFILVGITRNTSDNGFGANHLSETQIPEIIKKADYFIENNETLEAYHGKCKSLVDHIIFNHILKEETYEYPENYNF